jgi:hypothetical protein
MHQRQSILEGMSVFANLSAEDQAMIDRKLAELSQKTGNVWTLDIARQPQTAGGDCYLEVKVNGRSLQPLCLDAATDAPGARACAELDKLYHSRAVDTGVGA